MKPKGQIDKTPREWDQAEPNWDQAAHEKDLAEAKERIRTGNAYKS